MTKLATIFHDDSYYQVTYNGLTIRRIRRYRGDLSMPREVRFPDLSAAVKALIVAEMTKPENTNAKETLPV